MLIGTIKGGWKTHRFIEWGFIAALLVICVVLTALQSRWTDRLGQATTQQQSSQLRSQAELLCRTFDSQLNEACTQLRPSADQIDTLGREEAHTQTLQRWQAGSPRPMFRRLAVLVPEAEHGQLYFLDQRTARLTKGEWPPEWTALQRNLSVRAAGGQPQIFEDSRGILREHPVRGRRGPSRPGRVDEYEWMITELDQTYLRQMWLPELSRTFLNSGKQTRIDMVVKTDALPQETFFSTGQNPPPASGDVVSVAFNNKASDGGGGPDRGRDGPDEAGDGVWTLTVWPRAGEFAAIVSGARERDLTVACILDVCLLVGGLLLIHYARRARRLGDARMRFVAAVSHELRTPLTVILAAGQSLRRGMVQDPARLDKYAGMIVEHSTQLAEMVEQVLAFAGARRNESTLVHKPVVIAQILQEAIVACALETQAAHCEVETQIEPDAPPVLGDAQALIRMFQNLLGNAVKHGGAGKWIGVTCRYLDHPRPGYVEVEVSDHGAGIPPREQAHVFEPFFRGSRANGLQTRGSGIGLSVVQEIVRGHRGSVRVESHSGKGTTFTVRLPVAESAGEVAAAEKTSSP